MDGSEGSDAEDLTRYATPSEHFALAADPQLLGIIRTKRRRWAERMVICPLVAEVRTGEREQSEREQSKRDQSERERGLPAPLPSLHTNFFNPSQ